MAKKVSRKHRKNFPIINPKSGLIRSINLSESYTSLILGAIVVLIIGILFVVLAGGNRGTQTSSAKDTSLSEEETSQNSSTSSTYTVKPGDDLWTISENIYNNGFRWVEIAKINKLENPGLIYSGDKLSIPVKTQEKQIAINTQISPNVLDGAIESASITGNIYTVIKGDNLWDIAVRAYGDGFRWAEIARANNLLNPALIHSGNIFKIPR